MTISRRPPCNPVPYPGKLTVANLITDDTRTTGTQGDGLAIGSGAGVWPAATNLCTNGGGETNTTGWAIDAAKYNNISSSAGAAKFGSKSILASGVGSANNNFQNINFTYANAPIGTYTASAWFLAKNQTCPAAAIQLTNSTDGATTSSPTSVGTGTWVKITVTKTTTSVEDLVLRLYSNFAATSTGASGEIDMYFDGIQLETGFIATPYIHTDGGTASRSAGSIAMPAGVLDETQMWVALRGKHGWTTLPSTAPMFWSWGDSANERMLLYWVAATTIIVNRQTGGVGTGKSLTVSAPAIGDNFTLIGQWTATQVQGSYNGVALTGVPNNNIPSIASTTARIGTQEPMASGRELGGGFLWFAAGRGALTDADAALFHSWGNNAPLPHQFSKSTDLRFLAHFYGDGTAYRYGAA